MMRAQTFLLPALLISTVVAQDKTDLSIAAKASKNLKYTIKTSSEISTSREVLMDGEPMGFGRGGGGGDGQMTTIDKKVVFVDSADGTWRHYKTANAVVVRPGRDGEEQETEVTGEFKGKRLFFDNSSDSPSIRKDDAKGDALSERQIRGIPMSMDLSSLAPKSALEVGGDYDLSKGLRKALANMIHPVNAARPERSEGGRGGNRGRRGQGGERGEGGEGSNRGRRGEGGQGGNRGEGGQGGNRGQGGQGGNRGRGGRGGFTRGANTSSPALTALINDKLNCKASGKLVSIENGIAKIAISGTITGKGTPTALGMGMARFGRGRRGGGGGEQEDPGGEASVSMKLKGELLIDTRSHSVTKLTVKGSMDSSSEMVRETQRGEFEMNTTNSGGFSMKLACAVAKTEAVEASDGDAKDSDKK